MMCKKSVFVLIGSVFFCAQLAQAVEDKDCFACHGDPNTTKTMPDGTTKSLYVDPAVFSASIHAEATCVGCHTDITELPHQPNLEKVNCDSCHDVGKVYETSIHGIALKNGNKDVATCSSCHGVHDIRATADPQSHVNAKNLPATCGKCHSDPALVKRNMIGVRNPSESYLQSTHARALNGGKMEAATCINCHGAHDLKASDDPASSVYRRNIPETCSKCHPKEKEEYLSSIHGLAMLAGIKDSPVCTDCHGEHAIQTPHLKTSKVNAKQVVRETCPRCHDNEEIMYKYGIETSRQASYMDSFHGLASAAGSEVVASCTSCHGVHNILPPENPQSTVNHANLPGTCAKCHKDAGPNFAIGAVHIMPTAPDQKALGIVRIIYMLLIGGTIGGMVLHNTLVMARHAVGKFKEELSGEDTYRRFSLGLTVGHLVLTLSFTALAVSGFALRYPETWWAQLLFHGDAGLAARGVVHRIAAIVLVALAVVNAGFLVGTRTGRRELRMLMFGLKDLKDVFHNVFYIVGLARQQPKFDRYSYIEKFEYWGMWWGTVLMILTGFSMWFVNTFLQFLPKLALDIVALIHFYEAWLAVLTIVVWHLYYMIFDPPTYPMNWSWITGRITLEDMKHRHPLEYEREILQKNPEKAGDEQAV